MIAPIEIFAGQQAYRHVAEQGIQASDIRAIIGASGGPKWFVLSHLDRYLVDNWLPAIPHQIELIGSSIGAWRMAAYASAAPLAALEQLEYQYLNQRYSAQPTYKEVSDSIHRLLDSFIQPTDLNQHHLKKLHIVAARCKGLSQLEHRSLQALSFAAVALSNYSHTLMICPSRAFVESLPYGKIPDRRDFERLDNDARIRYWQTVVDRNQFIAEAFDRWVHSANPLDHVIPIETLAR